jgi:hypothetical protein
VVSKQLGIFPVTILVFEDKNFIPPEQDNMDVAPLYSSGYYDASERI